MVDIRGLLNQLANQEASLLTTQFLAPCVTGGRVRTKLSGLVYTFRPQPGDFQGWGIFQPLDLKTAKVVETANLPQVAAYLQRLVTFRLFLVRVLQGKTWLAFPMNTADMQQRLGWVKPLPVHLVADGAAFEAVTACWDGHSWWFKNLDRRADPTLTDKLRQAVRQKIIPEALNIPGLTPELRIVYDLVTQQIEGFSPHSQDEQRLQQALKLGGGQLQQFSEREDYWHVEWTSVNGQRHTSAIAKSDLTVMSAGICLSGRDRDFDLQSLVGVVEGQEEWD